MMQKRTNPLELKVDSTPRREATPAPVEAPLAEPKIVEPVTTEAEIPKVMPTAKPIENMSAEPVQEKKPLTKRPTIKPLAPEIDSTKDIMPEVEQIPEVKAVPAAPSAMRWERVSAYKPTPVAEPVAEPAQREPVVEEMPAIEDEIVETVEQDDLLGEEMIDETAADVENDLAENDLVGDDDEFNTEEGISDEDEPLTVDDYMMSARFSLCGRISRGMKIGKISRDVCRLAQLMHPEKSLSTIIEDALLTRIYLENPDAFDAMAEMLEKKGGHIKC